MMIKRFISMLISAALIIAALPVFSGVYAAEAEGAENKKISLLSGLGILNNMNLVEFDPDRTVVKKVFYSAVFNIMTEEEENDQTLISFLKRYNINVEAVEFGDNLKKSDALEAIVCMLGYSNKALKSDALLQAATELGLRRFVPGDLDEDITLGEMVNLLYAAIEEDMMTVSVTGTAGGGFKYERLLDTTPLIYYRDIYVVKGYVNKNCYASIVDNTPSLKGYVYIDSEEFSAGLTNAGDYLGMPVEAYVQYKGDEGTIIYITPNEKYVNIISVDARDIVSVDGEVKNIEYEYADRYKTAKLSSVVKVIFNGKNYTEYTSEDLMPDIGSLELIDSDRDNVIDVVNVKSYETVLVNYVSQYSETVVNKYHSPAVVDLDSEENEVIIEKDGQRITAADIAPNNVLLIAGSRSGKDEVIRVYVSDKQETGRIYGVDYEELEMTVGDNVYNMSKSYADEIKYGEEISAPQEDGTPSEAVSIAAKRPEIGKNYTLYLDAFGNIAYAVLQDGNIYLYATRLWYDEGEDIYGLKALNTEGVWNRYIFDEKLKFDGLDVKQTAKSVYDTLGGNGFTRQLLRVELNSEGKIRSLRTAQKTTACDDSKFTRYDMTTSRIYQNGSMCLGNDLFFTGNTKVFLIPPEEDASESQYQVVGASWFTLDSWYKVSGYDIDKFYRAPVVTYESTARTLNNHFYIVSEIRNEVISDEVRTVFKCLYQGSEVELVTEAAYETPDVKVGDMIRLATNLSGEINYMEMYKELEREIDKTYPSLTDATAVHKGMVLAAGYITDVGIGENMFLADCGNDTPARFKIINETKCYLYDGREKEKVRVITPSEMRAGDGIYVLISWTNARIVYAVRNVQ